MKPLRLALIVVLLAPLVSAQKKQKEAKEGSRIPEVGQIAPPIGSIQFLKLGGVQGETDLMALRGKVVVIADYGYYCDSCVRIGVPTVVALRAANEGTDLCIVQLTAMVGGDTLDTIREQGEALGLVGPVGITDVDGAGSPYLDMNANGNLTYAYVIGCSGGIVWKGDPSRNREEYVAAVAQALHAVPCEPLPAAGTFGPEVAPIVREYVLGNFGQAGEEVRALQKRLGTRSGADAERARSDASALLALVEGTRRKLMEELEQAGGDGDVERFQRGLAHVRRVFPKGPEAERAAQLEIQVTQSAGPSCRKWAAWVALEEARPATFPAEKDGANARYARELARYAKQSDVPGLEQAQKWLDAWDAVQSRK